MAPPQSDSPENRFWFVMVPGEASPHIYESLAEASAHADQVARIHAGRTISIYQLRSVGSVKYPNTPTIIGDFKK